MEMINVGNGKYKIILDVDDLRRFNIYGRHGNTGDIPEIKGILSTVKEEYGVDFSHKKVFAEYFGSKDGGGEVYLRTADVNNYIKSKDYTENKRVIDKCITNYGFLTLSDVIGFCKALYEDGYRGESAAFSFPWGYFCLEITKKTPLAGEYGGKMLLPEFLYIRKEYGKIICENAVERLKNY